MNEFVFETADKGSRVDVIIFNATFINFPNEEVRIALI